MLIDDRQCSGFGCSQKKPLLACSNQIGITCLDQSFSCYALRVDGKLSVSSACKMSDGDVDEDLLALLRKSLGIDGDNTPTPAKTRILEDAKYVCDSSTDVAIDMRGTKAAAASIWTLIREKEFNTRDWSKHELHPKARDSSTVDFIFLMDLINFCFWSDNKEPEEKFAVEYGDRKWTGYWSLVAAIQRALDQGIPITSPTFWVNEAECTDELLKEVFKSATSEEMPLLDDRICCIREAGNVLREVYSPLTLPT